jgi:c(7)-type cytochrome triheme protein
VLLALALAGFGSTGCAAETRYAVLSAFLDGVPPPGEERAPRRRRRRPVVEAQEPGALLAESAALAMIPEESLALPVEVAPTYATFAELEAAFPRDVMGNLDWVAAAKEGLIQPRPGIDPDTPDIVPMPLDVRLDPGIPSMEVVFPHAAHTYWLRCDNCHPAIFQMRAGADPITMAGIFAGEYCGRCHGKVAFPPATGCTRCHVKLGQAAR